MKIDITVEELVVLLTELGVDLKNEKVKETLINTFMNQKLKEDIHRKQNQTKLDFIKDFLIKCKFPISLNGFNCLARAIELKIDEPAIPLVSGIYEIIGKENLKSKLNKANTASKVERSLRHLLKIHFEEYSKNSNNYPNVCHEFYNLFYDGKVKNGEAITFFANYLSSLDKNIEKEKVLIKK